MSNHSSFLTKGMPGHCTNCQAEATVNTYSVPNSAGLTMNLCFLCASVPGAMQLRDDSKVLLNALSTVLTILKPKKMPKAPKQRAFMTPNYQKPQKERCSTCRRIFAKRDIDGGRCAKCGSIILARSA